MITMTKNVLMNSSFSKLFFSFLLVCCSALSWADDIQVFTASGTDARVLFVLDASGSMLTDEDGNVVGQFSDTKMQILLDALEEVVDNLQGTPGLGVGMTYYGGIMPSGIKLPALPLGASASTMYGVGDTDEGLTHGQLLLNMANGIFPEEDYSPVAFDLRDAGVWGGAPELDAIAMPDPDTGLFPVPECSGTPFGTFLGEDEKWADDDNSSIGGRTDDIPKSWGAWPRGDADNVPAAWLQKCPVPPASCERDDPQKWDPDKCTDKTTGESSDLFAGEWGYCQHTFSVGTLGTTVQVSGCETRFFALQNDASRLLTPTVDALYEAALYFRGDTVYHGTRDHFPSWSETKQSFHEPLVPIRDEIRGKTYDHGFPGLLENLSAADRDIYAGKAYSFDITTGPLWSWRAANPATYELNTDADSDIDPALELRQRRRYLTTDTFTGEGSELHTLDSNIFKYDCSYDTGSEWRFVHQSWHSCNLVESPFSINVRTEEKYEKVDNQGKTQEGNVPPTESDYLSCTDFVAGGFSCVDTNPIVDICPSVSDGGTPPEGCVEITESNCESSDINGEWEESKGDKRTCEFRFESVAKYQSPIGQCSKSAIVLISDGFPTANITDNGGDIEVSKSISDYSTTSVSSPTIDIETPGLIRKMIDEHNEQIAAAAADGETVPVGPTVCADLFTGDSLSDDQLTVNKSGACGQELSSFLNTVNQLPGSTFGTVRVNSIGFALPTGDPAEKFLQRLAWQGEDVGTGEDAGLYELATSRDEVVAAIEKMINSSAVEAPEAPALVISPGSSSLSSNNVVFAPVFKASNSAVWASNIKAYFLRPVYENSVRDTDADPYVVNSTSSDASSFWSDESSVSVAEGEDLLEEKVKHGGVNGWITTNAAARQMYFETPDWMSTGGTKFLLLNELLPPEHLGLDAADTANRDVMVNWFRSQPLADSLHSKPVMVSYDTPYAGVDKPDLLFVVSNRGLLHLFDVSNAETNYSTTGGGPREILAWMPNELGPKIADQYKAVGTVDPETGLPVIDSGADHIYGLDAELRTWRTVDADGNNKIYLFAGMRRGGTAMYMFDITTPGEVNLVWKIDPTRAGYSQLGQTWSPMSIMKVKDGENDKFVGVMGGGYHERDDVEGQRKWYSKLRSGRGIYIIDLDTGDVIHSIGSNDEVVSGDEVLMDPAPFTRHEDGMKWGVPAEVRILDASGDGYADRLYFGDMGGRLWRVNIISTVAPFSDAMAIDVSRVGDFAKNSDGDFDTFNRRRFYEPPAVARLPDGNLAVVIASGYRANPLNGVSIETHGSSVADNILFDVIQDRVYMIKEPSEYTAGNVDPYTALVDITNSVPDNLGTKRGWYLDLSEGTDEWVGEKVLSEPLITDYKVLFTTTIPQGGGSCTLSATENRFYSINLFNGTPSGDLVEVGVDGVPIVTVGGETTPTRYNTILSNNAIESEIAVSYVPIDGNSECAAGSQCTETYVGATKVLDTDITPKKIYWKETPLLENDCRFTEDCVEEEPEPLESEEN